MRVVVVAAALGALLASLSAGAQENGISDSHCWLGVNEGDTAPWRVDGNVPADLNQKLGLIRTLTLTDVQNLVDQGLQNQLRHSRARVRARVERGGFTCTIGDLDNQPCVQAFTNAEDPLGCLAKPGALAYGGCFAPQILGGCYFVFCLDRINSTMYDDGTIAAVLDHELAHAYGRAHPSTSDGVPCDGFDTPNCLFTSDGCEGELMCPVVQCAKSSFLAPGDATGLRGTYGGGFTSRRLYFGRDQTGTIDPPANSQSIGGYTTTYAPRIDCATDPNQTYACATAFVTRTGTDSQLRILALDDYNATNQWAVQTLVRTIATDVSMPIDIAVNATGSIAWLAFPGDNMRLRFARVPLNGSAHTIADLGVRPVLPPRVVYADGFVRVLSLIDNPQGGELYGRPRWWLQRVAADGSSFSQMFFQPATNGVDIDESSYNAEHMVVTDYDFDCTTIAGQAGETCTIVALMRHDDADAPVARPRSIRFRISNAFANPLNAQLLDTDWDYSAYDANGIIGVSLSPTELFVATSRPLTSGTDTDNTRVARYSGHRIAGTALSTNAHSADTESCAASSAYGLSMPAATTHGGYSIAWCPAGNCSSTEAIASVLMGRRGDNDTFCW